VGAVRYRRLYAVVLARANDARSAGSRSRAPDRDR
jgi:hypothetical protein